MEASGQRKSKGPLCPIKADNEPPPGPCEQSVMSLYFALLSTAQRSRLLPMGCHFAVDVKGVDLELLQPECRLDNAFHVLVNFIAHWLLMLSMMCLSRGTAGQATCVELLTHGCLTLNPWPYIRAMM